MKRARNKIKPETAENLFSFLERKGTSSAIYTLRILIEREVEVKIGLYVCFVDYCKIFDKVRHNQVMEMLENLNIDGKNLKVIKNIYWQQVAEIARSWHVPGSQSWSLSRMRAISKPILFI